MELKRNDIGADKSRVLLLIVPYGIETGFIENVVREQNAFNRTLWN